MKGGLGRYALVVMMGFLLAGTEGCGMKWLQSEGDTASTAEKSGQESEKEKMASGDGDSAENLQNAGSSSAETGGGADSQWNGQGVNPSFPGIAQEQGSEPEMKSEMKSELNGFSQSPTEEHLTNEGEIASVSPADTDARQDADLAKEERAAMEAGLKDVFFGYDQWTLSDAGMEVLQGNAKWLKEHPGAVLKVEGHCDERGTSAYNIVLGDKRSKSARNYLVELGVSRKQVKTVSYGKERPFCLEHTEACYQQNRRGHVLLYVKN
ncbi:OmpA family protein [Petrachloros mirabilis]